MKYYLLLLVLLSGCSSVAVTNAEMPTGEEVFDLIFMSSDIKLKNEPLCDLKSFSRKSENLTFGEHLSTSLSVSYGSDNETRIKSSCSLSKHELSKAEIIEVWDCKLEILEVSKSGEFISSSMIAFSADLGKTKIISGSIRCF